jgi:hypothetical protein
MLYLIITNLLVMPIAIALDNYPFTIILFSLIILLGLKYLYDTGKILGYSTTGAFTKDKQTNNQITTLFDKYPEEESFKRELPYNEPKITTLFGDDNKKNR